MKVSKNPAALAFALMTLQACSVTTSQHVTAPSASPTAFLDKPESIQPQSFVLRGEVVIGHESQYLMPCGSDKQYWLPLSPQQAQRAMALTTQPYQPMYGELIGYLKPSGTHGFAADFDAQFVVEQISLLTAENPNRCQQANQPTRVFGNEPAWSATFHSDHLIFQPLGQESQTLAIQRRQWQPRQRLYQFNQGELRMTENLCADTMSNSLYGWKASLELNGHRYQGCGTTANIDTTLDWSGTYVATSTLSQGFEVQMELNHDHSATTQYQYGDGQPPLIERGFWQQLNPSQIQVVMTHHQQQRLQSERLFTRQGNQLTASHEKVGNVVYPIAGGGLVLYPAVSRQSEDQHPTSARNSLPPERQDVPSSAQFDAKVDAAVRNYFAIHRTLPDNNQYRWLTYDLNGDGQEELLVQLDWCGSGGCTLLIFEAHQQAWRFNSRITLVQSPIYLGRQTSHGWYDLIFNVSGGGAETAKHRLQYSGISYPLNPSTAPNATPEQLSEVRLFSEQISPVREGVKL
ncbi:hypothetical protein [Vibrio sp. CAU 1672]|uniref:COG3650 family protein n=1 Tax=Vibrio sp. CAU 1672 TaxID=3032594 RepID=UPI0023DA3380|nr:hypothetical protein [Vibrio sp. CAU 1672]MDF2155905.1 hypothetical protein [Vibrio sp. CAU 1672]